VIARGTNAGILDYSEVDCEVSHIAGATCCADEGVKWRAP